MFVSTVVVGCVALASDVQLRRWAFARDAGALVLVLLLLVVLGGSSHAGAASAILLPAMYAVYVASVVLPACLAKARGAQRAVASAESPKKGTVAALSAFWHALSPRKGEESQDGYKPLPRDELESDAAAQHNPSDAHSFAALSPRKPSPRFLSKLYEDHFESGVFNETLSSPLIAEGDQEQGSQYEMDNVASPGWLGFTTGGGLLAAAYWRHLRWRWGMKRSIARVWSSDSSIFVKIFSIPQAALLVIRDVSVPLLDQDEWRRSLASLSPITVPMLVLLVTEHVNDEIHVRFLSRSIPLWQPVLAAGCLVGFIVSFTTHRSHAPTSFLYCAFFLMLAFVSCICWIYAVANELVALLVAMGIISHISNSLLSLTVLAWGNSVSDLITDVSVARAGFAQMAIAGCFGGLVFNILLGLGIPMVVTFLNGHTLNIGLDAHAHISLTFLLVSMTSTIAVFVHHGFHCPEWYGKLLIGYYGVYSVVNLVVAYREGHAEA